MNKTPLQAKVEARNLANATALEYAPRILEALKPLVGELMRTKEGARSAKLDKALAALNLPNTSTVSICVRPDSFWFRAEIFVSVPHDRGCQSAETQVYLGELDGRTLKSVADVPQAANYRTDYNAEEIIAARHAVWTAWDALHAAESKLAGFGEYDN